MEITLQGKIAVVTGAAGQIGRVIVRTLAACGADIAVCYLHSEAMAASLAQEVRAMGCRAVAVKADVTEEESVGNMRDAIKAALGNPDIVVNNAVIQYAWKPILDQSLADFQSQFDSCVLQSVLTAKAFLPAMIEKGGGRFIGVNTECSALCRANSGAYASAKRGMDGLYRVLAKEVGAAGVTVNQVAPGWTVSDNDRAKGIDAAKGYGVPLGRRGTDQEVANAVAFLASDLASYITGVCLPVSGGSVMV